MLAEICLLDTSALLPEKSKVIFSCEHFNTIER